ncbi:MAG: PKD domain-containing protein [Vicinamibacterales bacterium]
MSSSLRAAAAVLAATLAASACDKVPLLAPTNSSIRLVANVSVLPTNGSTEITAVVIESAGTPVQNGTVVTFTSSLGTVEPREARTTNGQVTVRYNSGSQSGSAKIGAFSGGSKSDDLEILVGAAAAGAITVRANPAQVPTTGGTAEIVATVVDTGGNALRGAPVTFSTDFGQLSQATAITDAAGEARTQLTTVVKSKVTARVGGGSSAPSATVDVDARNAPAVVLAVNGTTNFAEVFIPAVISLEPPSTSTANAIREVILNLGDGTVRNLGALLVKTTVSHTWTRTGTYTVTATATDVANFSATTSVAVTVTEQITVPVTIQPTVSLGSRVVTFNASAVSPNQTVTGPVRIYEWDFGDGSSTTTTGITTSHRYSAAGTYIVRVRVVTTNGYEGFGEIAVTVT